MASAGAENDSCFRSAGLLRRLTVVFSKTWDLGFTSFGGPPVHFQIFHQRFVEKYKWIDDETYQELFALCQALLGPASTKLGYCICLIHVGFLPALLQFSLWCLPGAIGMYALAIGVARVPETLPASVYALLSGLNASTVGVIAVSAVRLSKKAISDDLSRVIVIGTGCAGMLYSALWYFPVLICVGGALTLVADFWRDSGKIEYSPNDLPNIEEDSFYSDVNPVVVDERDSLLGNVSTPIYTRCSSYSSAGPGNLKSKSPSDRYGSVRLGTTLVAIFFLTFLTILIIRALIKDVPVVYKLFSNLFLAGSIIFGGGPVVVPLLNDYIVNEGWVSSRDFLIGLALIQAFPGPNFNFAVFLSALTASSAFSPPLLTATLGFMGIFLPGMVLATGMSALWRSLRRHRIAVYLLRGVNAGAVGLVWTAVYRLWESGYLEPESAKGSSLGKHPLWVAVSVIAFSGNCWFDVPPPVAIASGGALSLLVTLL
ncbi:chromate transporter [Phellopilus nigrolimitatus]|nr:chromate transporter [Phellopilus nigrolimitatus]